MTSYSSPHSAERAQPWLGTLVSMQVTGLPPHAADAALQEAFHEVSTVHHLMSFHDAASDLSRLNAARDGKPVDVHPYTFAVMRRALEFSAATQGCFDITVGRELVEWSMLPRPANWSRAAAGTWQDIELCGDGRIRLHRPLCLDLGGIAKGFAVDKATEALQRCGAARAVVNAGGDLRVYGDGPEWIALAAETTEEGTPILELENGSVASSGSRQLQKAGSPAVRGPHVDGVLRSAAPADRFVSVLCEECIVADALTKVVLVQGQACQAVLARFQASAYLHDPGGDWQHLHTTPEMAVAE